MITICASPSTSSPSSPASRPTSWPSTHSAARSGASRHPSTSSSLTWSSQTCSSSSSSPLRCKKWPIIWNGISTTFSVRYLVLSSTWPSTTAPSSWPRWAWNATSAWRFQSSTPCGEDLSTPCSPASSFGCFPSSISVSSTSCPTTTHPGRSRHPGTSATRVHRRSTRDPLARTLGVMHCPFLHSLTICSFCYINFIRILSKLPNIGRRRRLRAIGLALGTLLVFVLCFGPYNVSHVVGFITKTSPAWRDQALLLSTFNACLDPIIFYFTSAAVRNTLGAMMRGIWGRCWCPQILWSSRKERPETEKNSLPKAQEMTNALWPGVFHLGQGTAVQLFSVHKCSMANFTPLPCKTKMTKNAKTTQLTCSKNTLQPNLCT